FSCVDSLPRLSRPSLFPWAKSCFELTEELLERNADRFANRHRLNDVKATFPRLELAHMALWTPQTGCKIRLSNVGPKSELLERLAESCVFRRKRGLVHPQFVTPCRRYPKSGYYDEGDDDDGPAD